MTFPKLRVLTFLKYNKEERSDTFTLGTCNFRHFFYNCIINRSFTKNEASPRYNRFHPEDGEFRAGGKDDQSSDT